MTFEEVMKRVQEKGNDNQEAFKKYTYPSMVDNEVQIGAYETIMCITAEQFLAIYKILGE